MVPPRGFAPRSSAYRADALLLSYGGLGIVAGASRARPLWKRLASRISSPGETPGQRTAARHTSHFHGKWLRRPDSNRRYAAYETAALPLGYSAVYKGKLGERIVGFSRRVNGTRRLKSALRSRKNESKHRCQSGDGLAPAGKFLGGSFGVSGTPPLARTI